MVVNTLLAVSLAVNLIFFALGWIHFKSFKYRRRYQTQWETPKQPVATYIGLLLVCALPVLGALFQGFWWNADADNPDCEKVESETGKRIDRALARLTRWLQKPFDWLEKEV